MPLPKSIEYATNPTLRMVLQLLKEEIFHDLNCHQVGEIASFNPDGPTAEIEIKMKRVLNGELREYPLLVDCPVLVLSGGKGRLTFPIEKGDPCLILFNDRDIDNWFVSGQTMPPNSTRKHSIADALGVVGFRNKQNAILDYLTDGTELKYGDTTIQLKDSLAYITNGTATATLDGATVTFDNGAGSTIVMDATGIKATTSQIATVEAPQTDINSAIINLNGMVNALALAVQTIFTVQGKAIGPEHQHSGVQSGPGNTGGVV
ncbi:hypothetical protein AAIR98_000913 [Elusimicrobium simillimum]|uniref:Gp138 family membrane-puncturing spike protein n=1 Tax=Elusimicrobium simillimum TaxID=3143438 RepID=UPI003C6F8E90